MANAGYVGLSLQMALTNQLAVVANNVANISTTGFKGSRSLFTEYLSNPEHAARSSFNSRASMVSDYGTYRDTSDGSFKQTGNPLDIALQGDGYLVVQTAQGERYTRAGNLQLNAARQICDMNGNPIMGEGGAISIPETDDKITITGEGAVASESGQQGTLRIVQFANDQQLKSVGNSLYTSTTPGLPATGVAVKQFGLESSNVQPIVEMTRMIDLQRSYETVQTLMENEQSRERDAVSKLANVNS
jgi:flagellar basal-body rod protein FlgF